MMLNLFSRKQFVPVLQPIDKESFNADIGALKGLPDRDRVWRAVQLVLAQVHASYVAKAEGGDVNAIQRARGISAAFLALENARRTGHAFDSVRVRGGSEKK